MTLQDRIQARLAKLRTERETLTHKASAAIQAYNASIAELEKLLQPEGVVEEVVQEVEGAGLPNSHVPG